MPVQKCRNEPPATCPKEYKEALEEVLTLLFSGQRGGGDDNDDELEEENDMSDMGNSLRANSRSINSRRSNFSEATPKPGLFTKLRAFFRKMCYIPCDAASSALEEVLDKINALDQKEYNEAALAWVKRGLTVGGVGVLMYSNGELSSSKYVLTVLERLSDTISFGRILENTISTIKWTVKASGYSAKIIIGIALAKLCLDISLGLKKGVVKQLIAVPAVAAARIRTIAGPFREHIAIQTESEERALEDAVAGSANTGPVNNGANRPKNNSSNKTRKASVKRRASSRRR
jgi:hypothetical protein